MKKNFYFGLGVKFVAAFSFIIIFTSVVLSCFFLIYQSSFLKLFIENNVVSLAKSLAISRGYCVVAFGIDSLPSFAKEALEANGVIYSIVYDVKWVPLSSNIVSNENIERYISTTNIEISSIRELEWEKIYKRTDRILGVGEVMDVVVPILYSDYVSDAIVKYSGKENIAGVFRIGFSIERIKHKFKKITRGIVVLTLLVILIGIMMSFFLVKIVIGPIKKLIIGTRKISTGNLKYRVYLSSNDEFEDLASSFNSMADDMEIHINELNKEKEELLNLKIAFEDRNQELEKALEKVKNMQQDLIKAEKFATIGRLASSVAHELRNPLASIKNIAYFLSKMRTFDNDDKSKNMVQMLSSEVLRANKIITELLDYSRIKKLTKMSLDIESFFDKVIKMVPLPENIKLIRKIERFDVVLDPDKITQVIINLISNARDAMPPNGGEIIISTKKIDSICQIFVQDNACGMSKDTVKHIFDPLFTTKLKGIGLGLCIVKEIIEAHNGKISVSSEENIGTTFTIELPLK